MPVEYRPQDPRRQSNFVTEQLQALSKFLEAESQQNFDAFLAALRDEHQPASPSEDALVDQLAQPFWLGQRAMNLQTALLSHGHITRETEKVFALYLRYQSTHDRGFINASTTSSKFEPSGAKSRMGSNSRS